jgi:hypothetical protein
VNKRNLLRALGFTVILWGIGVVAVNNKGMASCTPETGMTAFLNKALFGPTAACTLNGTPGLGHYCAVDGSSCNLNTQLSPGNSPTKGKCTETQTGCACLTTPGQTY